MPCNAPFTAATGDDRTPRGMRKSDAMRPVRVCMYGGTDLQGMPHRFVSELAYAILDSMSAVIVTGGFRHSNENPAAVSTDVAALRGGERYASTGNAAL